LQNTRLSIGAEEGAGRIPAEGGSHPAVVVAAVHTVVPVLATGVGRIHTEAAGHILVVVVRSRAEAARHSRAAVRSLATVEEDSRLVVGYSRRRIGHQPAVVEVFQPRQPFHLWYRRTSRSHLA
jgi:hypothetical protein